MLNLAETSVHHVCMWFSRDGTHQSLTHSGLLLDIPLFGVCTLTHTHTHSVALYYPSIWCVSHTFCWHTNTCMYVSLTHTHTHSHAHCTAVLHYTGERRVSSKLARKHPAPKLYITRSNDACRAHRHARRLCIMWSNDACSYEACYIHPPVPYIMLQPSILCDSPFDAL